MTDDLSKFDMLRALKGIDRRIGQTEVKEVPLYETGTFTPVYQGTGTAGVWTYSLQIGRYIRLGNAVLITIDIQSATRPTPPTGNARITGLPFTAVNVTNAHHGLALGQFDGVITGTQLCPIVLPNTTTLGFIEIPAGGGANNELVATALGATTLTRLSGYYEIEG